MDVKATLILILVVVVFAAFALALVAGFVGIIVMLVKQSKARRENLKTRSDALAGLARRLGLDYYARAELSTLPFLRDMEFNEGARLHLENYISGQFAGKRTAVFDILYLAGAPGHGRNRRRQTMCVFESPRLNLPKFDLRPAGMFDGLFSAGRDIDFSSHTLFSDQFTLSGDDEAAIRRIFTPSLLSFFESSPTLSVYGKGRILAVTQSEHMSGENEIEGYLAGTADLVRRFGG